VCGGGEPLLSSEQEMEGFRAFCAEREIKFVLVPSG
jgi:MoaA/NifB/PqqE/SkfB family radical SAM enzyme